ncbi:MAG: hypothetical protein M1834_000643 [Cirrosporium novae-zelandiae]|nr:MAG: hypothetical protein M1834_000643 [Cirrosporium novae-zelandiae]
MAAPTINIFEQHLLIEEDVSPDDAHPSFSQDNGADLDQADFECQKPYISSTYQRRPPFLVWLRSLYPHRLGRTLYHYTPLFPSQLYETRASRRRFWQRRSFLRYLWLIVQIFLTVVVTLITFAGLFRPSYTNPPEHYKELEKRVSSSDTHGRANINNEKVFIAASIYDPDGELVDGAWGRGVLDLIDLLGEDNVFLSIYENCKEPVAKAALDRFKLQVTCNNSILHEDDMSIDDVAHIILPDGSKRVKRIAYLAEVRNRALRALDGRSLVQFDKLLYLNDIIFDPVDAAQLLFSTHAEGGRADYRAACAVDFINAFKFYDTFATRDLEGYSMGIPFYPWFSSSGDGESRQDVLNQKDAVRVRSCWGGMVAFDANYFQGEGRNVSDISPEESIGYGSESDRNLHWHWSNLDTMPSMNSQHASPPARFRSEPDLYWDASECCLIHADIQEPPKRDEKMVDTGIYMNPYVRVAYTSRTHSWLRFTRRFERLYSIIHNILNHAVGLPRLNARRAEIKGEVVYEKVWVEDRKSIAGGAFQTVERVAGTGGFCGVRFLQVIKEDPKEGEKMWEMLPVPNDSDDN